MLELFLVAVYGKLFIFLVQNFPYTKEIKIEFWHKLFNCDLCLGTWIYFSLCAFMKFDMVSSLGLPYTPIVNQMLTAGFISYIMHLITLGFKLRHGMPFEEVG